MKRCLRKTSLEISYCFLLENIVFCIKSHIDLYLILCYKKFREEKFEIRQKFSLPLLGYRAARHFYGLSYACRYDRRFKK